jgi:uncharacterized protein YndB with AHSA1/START domain
MDPTVERTIELAEPPETVWRAITSSRELAAWFGAAAEVDAKPGGAVRFRWPDGSERRGVVEIAEAPRRFAFRWRPIVRLPEGVSMGNVSRVELRLEPRESGGTRLTVSESPGIAGVEAIGRTIHAAPRDAGGSRWRLSG